MITLHFSSGDSGLSDAIWKDTVDIQPSDSRGVLDNSMALSLKNHNEYKRKPYPNP